MGAWSSGYDSRFGCGRSRVQIPARPSSITFFNELNNHNYSHNSPCNASAEEYILRRKLASEHDKRHTGP